jgi:hypothetical protein
VNAVVHHLSKLIRIPSPSYYRTGPVIDYAVNALQQAQWHSRLRDSSELEANSID